jgi:hypothetical protein
LQRHFKKNGVNRFIYSVLAMLNMKNLLGSALFLSLIIAGCEEKQPEPSNTLTAKAGADQNVNVGDLVALDGSMSADKDNKPFDYRWAFTKKPAGSTANLNAANTSKPSFTPDLAGEYEAELTISNANGESKDRVLIAAAVLQPIALEAEIKTNLVLEDRVNNPDIPDYVANQNVLVNAELTIKPGVVIAFARDARLEVNDGKGVLIAKGDAAKRIRFIGKEATKGFWAGVVMRSASSANALDYVDVLHTGSKPLTNVTKAGMAVMGGSKAQISIKNSVFEKNNGFGLFMEHGAVLEEFANNTFKENAEAGILLNGNQVGQLDVNSVFTGGNGRNVVEILASEVSGGPNKEIIWKGFKDKTPYRVLESLTIDAGLKLLPGVVIEMSRGARLSLDGENYLNAVGTQESPIVIKGVENTPAYWRGFICFSTSAMNVFEHAEITGGGSTALVSGKKTNIAVYGSNARMQIKNSKVNNSGGYGIFVNYQARINDDVETVNTFTGNVDGKLFKE